MAGAHDSFLRQNNRMVLDLSRLSDGYRHIHKDVHLRLLTEAHKKPDVSKQTQVIINVFNDSTLEIIWEIYFIYRLSFISISRK